MTEATNPTGFTFAETMAELWLTGQQNRLKLLVYSGLPASGKTKAALEWVAKDPDNRYRCNYDDLRLELFGLGWKFNFKDERFMQDIAHGRVVKALIAGKSVVIDNTNLTPRSRDKWKSVAVKNNALHIEQEFDTPVITCKRRDESREGSSRVGWAVIDHMALFNGFIDWDDKEVYLHPNFIVVDMDGTLSDCSHRKHFVEGTTQHLTECSPLATFKDGKCIACGAVKYKKDWGSFFRGVGEDPPVPAVVKLVKHFYFLGYDVLVVSGRPMDQCGTATEAWLRKHLSSQGVTIKHLFMRRGQDQRPDTEVKQEILDMLPKNRIGYVLDDRDSVVEMWRSNGLTCLQVAKGNF